MSHDRSIDGCSDAARAAAIGALESAESLVYGALPEIVRMRNDVRTKGDGTPVTAADVWLEGALRTCLEAELGDVDLVGEETYGEYERTSSEWAAAVDPIDGTENFASGLVEWGTSVSLWHRGQHAASLVVLPELRVRLRTGDPVVPYRSRIVGYSSNLTADLLASIDPSSQARVSGCAVYNMWCVITGRFRQFVNPVGAYSWDLQAGVVMALEHGCEVRIDGEQYGGQYLQPGRRYRVDVLNRHGDHLGKGSLG